MAAEASLFSGLSEALDLFFEAMIARIT